MTLDDLYNKVKHLRRDALAFVDDDALAFPAVLCFRAALAHLELAQVELDRAGAAQAEHLAELERGR